MEYLSKYVAGEDTAGEERTAWFGVSPPRRAPRTVRAGTVDAAAALGPIVPGLRRVMVTRCLFSLYDVVDVLLPVTGPADVVVATWTMSPLHMERVRRLLDAGAMRSFRLIIDRSFVTRQPEYVGALRAAMGAGVDIRMTKTHAKFVLVGNDAWHVTIRSSANYNQSPRLENIDVDDDAEIYGFFKQVADEVRDVVPAGVDVSGAESQAAWQRLWPADGAAEAVDVAPDAWRAASRLGDDDARGWLRANSVALKGWPSSRKGARS